MLRFIRIRMHVSRHIWKGDSFLAALTNGITMAKTVVMIMKDGIPVKKQYFVIVITETIFF